MIKTQTLKISIIAISIIFALISCSKINTDNQKPSKELIEISISSLPNKTEYIINEALDLTGLVVTATYSDKSTEKLNITAKNISGFSSSKASDNLVLTITLDKLSTQFSIKVIGLNITDGVVTGLEGNVKELTLPSYVRAIGNNAFSGKKIEKITLNEGLKSIGNMTFANSSISSINFPSTLTDIGEAAFYECTNLTEIDLSKTQITQILSECFAFSSVSKLILPNSIISIGSQAFLRCPNLKNIALPYGTNTIGNEAFRESALLSIALPNSIYAIKQRAFYNCANLESVTTFGDAKESSRETVDCLLSAYSFEACNNLKSFAISSGIKVIGQNSISKAPNLTSITLGANIKKINFSAFANSSLASVKMEAINPPIAELIYGVWYGFPEKISSIVVPKGSAQAYKNADGWKDFAKVISE